MLPLGWVLGCEPPPHIDRPSSGTIDTELEDSEQEDTEAPVDDSSPTATTCPLGMVPVSDIDGVVHFCIDAFEVSRAWVGALGEKDQLGDWPDGSTTEEPVSERGVEPLILVSFYQAAAMCLNVDKTLCTTEQWLDACDGQVGEGGRTFPWGDEPDYTICATVDEEGAQVYERPQATGSFPDCVTVGGAYDMAGNVWEWTDPGYDGTGPPPADKVGGAYYSGEGNYECAAKPVQGHPRDFYGTIGFRCCTTL